MSRHGKQHKAAAHRITVAALVVRAVAILLVVVFAAAALHEVLFALLGHEHEHDHATCPFCLLIHMPALFCLSAFLLAAFFIGRALHIPMQEAPVIRRFVQQPDPRAPPLL